MEALPLLLLAALSLVDRAEEAGLQFRNICGQPDKRFIYETLGAGAAFLDYDMDGDLDIYLVNGAPSLDGEGPPNKLFRNDGDGLFRDATDESGTGDRGFGVAVAVSDVNADGAPDVYVANNGPDVLFLNRGDGTFLRAGPDVLPSDDLMAGGAAFGDYDRDGWPDLYVSSYVEPSAFQEGGEGAKWCNWRGIRVGCGPRDLPAAPDRLYRNRHGRLEDVSESSAVASAERSYGLGILFQDLDDDGFADIYVANDSVPNFLFINNGDGTFIEDALTRALGYSGEGLEQAGMGVDAGDIDGDGHPDIVVTNFSHDHTTLYWNQGQGFFADASYRLGVAKSSYFALSWGTRFVDLDADGALDLFIANGHIYPQVDDVVPECRYAEPNHVFLNDGSGKFQLQEGLGLPSYSSRGAASGDYDNDGRVDILVNNIDAPPELLHNETEDSGASVLVQLVGEKSSRDGTGALVIVTTGDRVQKREVSSAGSYASANDVRLHFGLGSETTITAIEVQWPSGERDRISSAPAASILVFKEGRGLVALMPIR